MIQKMKLIENLNGWVCGLGHGINKTLLKKRSLIYRKYQKRI